MSIEIGELDKKAAEDLAVKEFTNLYNTVKEKDLDISKLELVIRNTFYAGRFWREAVMRREAEGNKTYADGLRDMFDAAQEIYEDADDWDEFYDDLLSKRKDLESDNEDNSK